MNTSETVIVPGRNITKRVREFHIPASDRVDLLDAANRFVGHMIDKQSLAYDHGIPQETPLSPNESQTLDAALNYLRRQWETGYTTPEPQEIRNEYEVTENLQ